MIDSNVQGTSEELIRERFRDKEINSEVTDKPGKEKGTIKTINHGGFGFIKSAVGDKELFFHSSSVVERGTFELLRERDEVLYRVGWDDRRDKEMAIEIEVLGNKIGSGTKKGGVIARLNSKGFGFIQPHDSEQRIYFHSTCVAPGDRFEMLREGDEVEYDEGFDEKVGKPQANSVQSCRKRGGFDGRDTLFNYNMEHLNGPNAGTMMSQLGGMNNYASMGDDFGRGPSQSFFDTGGRPSPTSIGGFDSGLLGVLVGRIKSKSEKGFGFIEPLNGGEAVYFHRTGMQRYEGWDEIDKDDKVSFVMGWDQKNDKKMAQGVRLLSKCSPYKSGQGWFGKVTGRISSLNNKGFGFINTGEDSIYFHSTGLFQVGMDTLSVGDYVVFTKGWDSKNRKEMATQVELRYNNRSQVKNENWTTREGDSAANGQPPSRTGHIIAVNSKGFGFIKTDDGTNSIYFHQTGLVNPEGFNDLKDGDPVVFEDGWDQKNNKVMAVNVQLQ